MSPAKPATSMQVIVVGGGIGGLAAALALRRVGVAVTVLERVAKLREVGAGLQAAPNATRVLLALGLRERMQAVCTEPQEQVRRRWQDGSIIGLTPLGRRVQERFNAPYWHFHRADLHAMLLDACLEEDGEGPVVKVQLGQEVIGIENVDTNRPTVRTQNERLEADAVIGADGIHSRLRPALGFAETLVDAGEQTYRALIDGRKVQQNLATRFFTDRFQATIWYGPGAHLVTYFVRGGAQLNVVVQMATDHPEVAAGRTLVVGAKELAASLPGWDPRVTELLLMADKVLLQPLTFRRPDTTWTRGRAALLGDACHAMLPYQAQGASQSIEDAAVLAEELGSVPPSEVEGALLRYQLRRAGHAGRVQRASYLNKTAYHLPDGPEQEERDRNLASGFSGESEVSYDWLWRGTPLTYSNPDSFSYRFSN